MELSKNKASWTMAILCGLLLAFTSAAEQNTSLVIRGQKGSAKVVQVQRQNYVEIDGLAQLIVTRGHFLAAMAAAKQFIDEGSCQ